MKRRKFLAFIMVITFMMTFMVSPVQASVTSVKLDCLTEGVHGNHPGEHDVYVHFEDDVLDASDVTLVWNDSPTQGPDTSFDVEVDFSGLPTDWQFDEFQIVDTLYSGTKADPGPPASGYPQLSTTVANPFAITTPCYSTNGPQDWEVFAVLEVLVTYLDEDGIEIPSSSEWLRPTNGWDSESWYSPGTPTPPIAPTVFNKEFSHWVVQGETAPVTFAPVSGPTTYQAVYTPDQQYPVSYDANGGTGTQSDSSSPYFEGATVTVLGENDMALTNYHFDGWNTASDGSGTDYAAGATFSMPAAPVVLYAQWEMDTQYPVSYDANGGTGTQSDSSSPYFEGATVTVLDENDMALTNYHFDGWNTASDGSGTDYAAGATFSMPAAPVVLYAQWEMDTQYPVSYDANGGTGTQSDSSSPYFEGATVTVLGENDMALTNYHFDGWNTASDGSGTDYAAGATFSMPAAPVVLYAQWEMDTQYPVSYDANGGTGTQSDSSSPYFEGATVTVLDENDMALTNYHFDGWNTASDGSGTDYAAGATFSMPAAPVVLYAQWELTPTYGLTIEKLVNGESSATVTAGDTVSFTITVRNTGNTDLMMATVSDSMSGPLGSFNVLTAGAIEVFTYDYVTDGEDYPGFDNVAFVEAYTQQEGLMSDEAIAVVNVNEVPETYTVTYTPGAHGTFSPDITTGLNSGDSTPSAPSTPGDPGWSFTGWEPTPSELVDGDATYVAQWREIPPSPTPPPPPPSWNPSIEVSITPDATLVEIGTEVTFTIVVTNTGNTVLNNVSVVDLELGLDEVIPTLFVLGSETFAVPKTMDTLGDFNTTVTAAGTSPQVVAVSDTDLTAVEIFEIIIPPPPEPPPENPPTGAIPFDAYSVSGLLAMGAGIFALIRRKKDEDEDED